MLADWISRNIVLPEGLVAEPGPMKLWPYQVEIADCLGDPSIERVTLVKAARVGFTSLLTAAIGYWCARDPAPILCLLPTESDCKDYVISDIEPLFEASPSLKKILIDSSRTGQRGRPAKGMTPFRNTILSRRFKGGSLKIVAAKAPRNLRRHTARILLIDEADAMENSCEGDVVALAEKRTMTFANRKIILGSTPIDEETSHVCRAYAASDQRVWEVPCPECGAFAEIQWSDIEWPPGEPEKAAYRCAACNALVDEKHKAQMLSAGAWRPLAPQVVGHAGFRLSALVSPLRNASWGRLAAEFLAAKGDPATLKPFINTVLAQGWRSEEVEESALLTGDFSLQKIPPEVLILTCFCDVQADRLEVSYCGWTKVPGECFVLAHQVIFGPTSAEGVWRDLSDLLLQRFPHT
jgi:phage terminase large subunit GpA-like protein